MLDRIGNCRIVKEIASGGMAVIYLGVQEQLNRTVAIKALKTAVASEQQLVTRFEREAQSLAKLQHENLIQVYDYLEERGALFIVMEHVEGIDLYDLLDRSGRLPFDVAAIIATQVARALDYVHYRKIIHRDIKPANIMISRDGGVKVMDFGIARDRNFSDLTEVGTGIGTPSYMSPEQILGDQLDARSDIFSLGVVLYQMLTGSKPFVEDEQKSVMHKIRLSPHVPTRRLNPEVPRELDRIVDRCLRKSSQKRWRSAQSLVIALEHFLAKHVEMNHHSRLVLFLKTQDVITELEAEQYLNPALAGPGASLRAQTANAARRTVSRGALVQAGIGLLTALMITLIHLVPVGSGRSAPASAPAPTYGYVRLIVHPWGQISANGNELGITPLTAPFELVVGKHELEIRHDYFEPFSLPLKVPQNLRTEPLTVYVNLEEQGKRKPSQ